MATKATISYTYEDDTQDCVTGNIIKSSEDTLVIHPTETRISALRFNKNNMQGSLLESNNSYDIDIEIMEYNKWTFKNEIHFLLPNEFVNNPDEISVSGIYNAKKTISKDKITIETNDTLFKLLYNDTNNSWSLDKECIVDDKEYHSEIYTKNRFSSDIFYLGTNYYRIDSLGVNGERIE